MQMVRIGITTLNPQAVLCSRFLQPIRSIRLLEYCRPADTSWQPPYYRRNWPELMQNWCTLDDGLQPAKLRLCDLGDGISSKSPTVRPGPLRQDWGRWVRCSPCPVVRATIGNLHT